MSANVYDAAGNPIASIDADGKNITGRQRIPPMHKKALYIFGIGALLIFILCAVLNRLSRMEGEIEPIFQEREVISSGDSMKKIWEYDGSLFSDHIITNDITGKIYSINNSIQNQLVCFNPLTGENEWVEEIPFNTGSHQLLISGGPLFSANIQSVSAYDASNGRSLWSTDLGAGHVSYTLQMDHSILRNYYGEQIFEISPETGNILNVIPAEDTLWIIGDYKIHQNTSGTELITINRRTGKQIWKKNIASFLRDPQPQLYKDDYLIVKNIHENYCAMILKEGKYRWCLEGDYISNFAIDDEKGVGFILNRAYKLLKVNLSSGKIIGSASFQPGEQQGNTKDSPFRYRNYLGVTSDQIVVLFLGDSQQLLGLSWK